MNAITENDHLVSYLNDMLGSLVKGVVSKPDEVTILQSSHGPLVAFIIKTAPQDVPRVIGAKGKHFRALEAIIGNLAKKIGRETHLSIDESGPRNPGQKILAFGIQKDLAPVEALMRKTVAMFMDRPDAAIITRTDLDTKTTVLHIKIDEENYDSIIGPETSFEYGVDGLIIGSIKNLFDGIGKNHGRLIRVVLSKV